MYIRIPSKLEFWLEDCLINVYSDSQLYLLKIIFVFWGIFCTEKERKKQYILSNVNSQLNFKGVRSFACHYYCKDILMQKKVPSISSIFHLFGALHHKILNILSSQPALNVGALTLVLDGWYLRMSLTKHLNLYNLWCSKFTFTQINGTKCLELFFCISMSLQQ